jgi:Tfp pilus assembly protein PilF
MWRWICCALCLLPLLAQPGRDCPGGAAAPEIAKGVRAFKNAQYADAVAHFRAAVDQDANCTPARLYLATAYMQQYIPGADSPDNQQMAASAREQFEAVLEKEPENEAALASMASLYFNMKKLDAAETWYKRMIAVNPESKEAYYTLGVIAWTRTFQPIQAARTEAGMKPEDPGPVEGDDLRGKYLAVVQQGIDDLGRAIEIDPQYDDAMAYMNLVWREKADLEGSRAEYDEDVAKANVWFQKAMDTRKTKAAPGRQM